MTNSQVVVHGVVKADGTLELTQPIALPPGEVQVTVETLRGSDLPREAVWGLLERIWADQEARGVVPRTREEIDAEVDAMRDEAEERFRDIAVEQLP